jgi:hypothetical protein
VTRARRPTDHEIMFAARDSRLRRAIAAQSADTSWRTRGRCRTVDPDMFFPLPTYPSEPALSVCWSCDVQAECLATALDIGEEEGVWGGTTARERRAMLVAWRSRRTRAVLR